MQIKHFALTLLVLSCLPILSRDHASVAAKPPATQKAKAEDANESNSNGSIILIDFEGKDPLSSNNTSHKAEIALDSDTPKDGGQYSAKTIVDTSADTQTYFGTGFSFETLDLSSASEIRFWIKTDIQSGFNFQVHSFGGGTSVSPFMVSSPNQNWKEVVVRLSNLRTPPWARGKSVDLTAVNKIQVTAFGNGPYGGKYISLDQVIAKSGTGSVQPTDNASEILQARQARLKEPVILKRGEIVDMFDGKTLDGWMATPRVYVPRGKPFATMPSDQLYDAVIKHYEQSDGQLNRIPDRERARKRGIWKIENGVVTGGQVPGSIAGAYLISEKTYGDFELTLEANPDYPIDTGIMVRAHRLGSIGYQVLVDNRPNGTIGGVYGNSVGHFFAYPFVFDADEEPGNRIANLRPGNPNALKFRGGQFKTDFAANLNDFKKVWNLNDWNEIKIRCTGRLPLIETWINGIPIAKIDTATLADQVTDYDAEAIYRRIGRKGHIGLEVHDSPTRDRWAPGAECRWRNVRIQELEVQPSSSPRQRVSKSDGVVKRGGPVYLGSEPPAVTDKTPPPGFRSLFNGKTLDGWQAAARLPVPQYPGAPLKWRLEGKALEVAKQNKGRWTVEDGAIIGGQEPPGSGKGAYLVSKETFGDFELMMDMKPDWKTDSGFLVRTLPGGSPGMQILVDHRPQGGIGGFYGNGIAGIHGMAFAIDAKYDAKGNPIGMIAANAKGDRVELTAKTRSILKYAAEADDFLNAWKWGQWNTIKVRCVGRIPTLTTWVNGLKIAEMDMNAIEWENYDREACAEMMGRRGHISLEVHNNNFNHWLGKDRWWPGAVVRWKNIFIREFDAE